MDCFVASLLAMTMVKKSRARPWGTGGRARLKEEVGAPPPFIRRQREKLWRRLNRSTIRLSVSRIEPVIIFSSASVAVFGSVTVLGVGTTTGRFSAAT